MSPIALSRILDLTPALALMYRLQYERAQDSWVMLYPEGMVKLNGSASEILRRCDGDRSVRNIVDDLQRVFGESALAEDVCVFVGEAYERGWLR